MEALKIKPHHAEGAQRFIAHKTETQREMYELLLRTADENPDAELVFVRGEDLHCTNCIKEGNAPQSCPVTKARIDLDEEVAREHGWEFDKPYKIKDILAELDREAPGRVVFAICTLNKKLREAWLKDIRASKRNAN